MAFKSKEQVQAEYAAEQAAREAGHNIVRIKGVPTDVNAKEFSGEMIKVIWKSQDNDFKIVQVGHIVCKGVVPNINIGAMYVLTGKFEKATKGRSAGEWQFNFTEAKYRLDTKKGLSIYLAKECPQIGEAIALRLVNKYGEKTIDMLADDNTAERMMMETQGFPRAKFEEIKEWAKSEKTYRSLKQRLYNMQLTPSVILKLIKAYGADTEQKLRENCFQITDIHGFGFKTADTVSIAMGIPRNDKQRIEAGILYTVENSSNFGHTCFVDEVLIKMAAKEMNLGESEIKPVLEEMISSGKLLTDSTNWSEYQTKHNLEY